MGEKQRAYPRLSACGLNCGLCPRHHVDGTSRCPGCGGEGFAEKRPMCGIISCNRRHGEIEFCYLCDEYPCKKLEGAHLVDSFITHRNMMKDFERAKSGGLDGYRVMLDEKVDMLRLLLEHSNDGRRKSFYCLAVNLLELEDVRQVMARLAAEAPPESPDLKARAQAAVGLFEACAQAQGVVLKLNRKPPPENKGAGT